MCCFVVVVGKCNKWACAYVFYLWFSVFMIFMQMVSLSLYSIVNIFVSFSNATSLTVDVFTQSFSVVQVFFECCEFGNVEVKFI